MRIYISVSRLESLTFINFFDHRPDGDQLFLDGLLSLGTWHGVLLWRGHNQVAIPRTPRGACIHLRSDIKEFQGVPFTSLCFYEIIVS